MPFYALTTTRDWTTRANYAAGDGMRALVVRASTADHARRVAAGHAGDEGGTAWLDPSTTVVALDPDGPDEVLGRR